MPRDGRDIVTGARERDAFSDSLPKTKHKTGARSSAITRRECRRGGGVKHVSTLPVRPYCVQSVANNTHTHIGGVRGRWKPGRDEHRGRTGALCTGAGQIEYVCKCDVFYRFGRPVLSSRCAGDGRSIRRACTAPSSDTDLVRQPSQDEPRTIGRWRWRTRIDIITVEEPRGSVAYVYGARV